MKYSFSSIYNIPALVILLSLPGLCLQIEDMSTGVHSYALQDTIFFNESARQTLSISLPENATVMNAVVNITGYKDGPYRFSKNIAPGEFSFGDSYNIKPKCARNYTSCYSGGCEKICDYYEETKTRLTEIDWLGEDRTNCSCNLYYYLEQKCQAESANRKFLATKTNSSICFGDACINNKISCEQDTERHIEPVQRYENLNCTCGQEPDLVQSIYVYEDSWDWNRGSAGTKFFDNTTVYLDYGYYSYPRNFTFKLGGVKAATSNYLNNSIMINITDKLIPGENQLNFEVSELGGYAAINLTIEYKIVPVYPVVNVSFEKDKGKILSFALEPNDTVESAVLYINTTKTGPHNFSYNETLNEYFDDPECGQYYWRGEERLCSFYDDEKIWSETLYPLGENQTACSCSINQETTKECAAIVVPYGETRIPFLLKSDAGSSTCINSDCLNHSVVCDDFADICTEACDYGEKLHEDADIHLYPACDCSSPIILRDKLHLYQNSVSETRAESSIPEHHTTFTVFYEYESFPQNFTIQINDHTAEIFEYANRTEYAIDITDLVLMGKNMLNLSVSEIGGVAAVKVKINDGEVLVTEYYPEVIYPEVIPSNETVEEEDIEPPAPNPQPTPQPTPQPSPQEENTVSSYSGFSVNLNPEIIPGKPQIKPETPTPEKKVENPKPETVKLSNTPYMSGKTEPEPYNTKVNETLSIEQSDAELFFRNMQATMGLIINGMIDIMDIKKVGKGFKIILNPFEVAVEAVTFPLQVIAQARKISNSQTKENAFKMGDEFEIEEPEPCSGNMCYKPDEDTPEPQSPGYQKEFGPGSTCYESGTICNPYKKPPDDKIGELISGVADIINAAQSAYNVVGAYLKFAKFAPPLIVPTDALDDWAISKEFTQVSEPQSSEV